MANPAELSKICEELEDFLMAGELDIEFQVAEEYIDQHRIDLLERVAQNAPRVPAVNRAVPFRQESAATTLRPRLLQLWTGFHEQSEQAIHNGACTPLSKFHCVRHYVTGEAAAEIAGLPTTKSCYAEAMGSLNQWYGNKKRTQQHHLSVLRNLPPVKSTTDVVGGSSGASRLRLSQTSAA